MSASSWEQLAVNGFVLHGVASGFPVQNALPLGQPFAEDESVQINKEGISTSGPCILHVIRPPTGLPATGKHVAVWLRLWEPKSWVISPAKMLMVAMPCDVATFSNLILQTFGLSSDILCKEIGGNTNLPYQLPDLSALDSLDWRAPNPMHLKGLNDIAECSFNRTAERIPLFLIRTLDEPRQLTQDERKFFMRIFYKKTDYPGDAGLTSLGYRSSYGGHQCNMAGSSSSVAIAAYRRSPERALKIEVKTRRARRPKNGQEECRRQSGEVSGHESGSVSGTEALTPSPLESQDAFSPTQTELDGLLR